MFGEYLSELCQESTYGNKTIDDVVNYISAAALAIKGFNRRGLYRMKQFYEFTRMIKGDVKNYRFFTSPLVENNVKVKNKGRFILH